MGQKKEAVVLYQNWRCQYVLMVLETDTEIDICVFVYMYSLTYTFRHMQVHVYKYRYEHVCICARALLMKGHKNKDTQQQRVHLVYRSQFINNIPNQGFLEKQQIPGLGQENYKVILEHLVVPESREFLRLMVADVKSHTI